MRSIIKKELLSFLIPLAELEAHLAGFATGSTESSNQSKNPLGSYCKLLENLRFSTIRACHSIDEENWTEANRHIEIIQGLASMLRDIENSAPSTLPN
jgi:hypothetical protein